MYPMDRTVYGQTWKSKALRNPPKGRSRDGNGMARDGLLPPRFKARLGVRGSAIAMESVKSKDKLGAGGGGFEGCKGGVGGG
jgi:hypothetical protein